MVSWFFALKDFFQNDKYDIAIVLLITSNIGAYTSIEEGV